MHLSFLQFGDINTFYIRSQFARTRGAHEKCCRIYIAPTLMSALNLVFKNSSRGADGIAWSDVDL